MKKIFALLMIILTFSSLLFMAFINGEPDKFPQQKWTTGIALYSFNRHPLNKALSMAKASGVKYVEGFSFHGLGPDFGNKMMGNLNADEIALVRKMLIDNSLEMSSIYVDGAKNAEEWKNFFEMGRMLNIKYLVCEPPKAHWDMVDSLASIYKIKVAIHEHKKGSSMYWHPDSVLAAIKGHKNIEACADLGHWVRSGLDPVKCLKMLEGHVIGVHLKDIDKTDHETDVDFGTGSLDYPAIVKELRRQRFAGVAHVECEHNMEDNLEIVKASVQYFRNIK
ncbi:MAG TPA: TIM barrel protein [Pedobacter sp.]|nr:TIM barrel protein [Pedobacter sp.]